jgi:hypothetical protein
VAYFEDFTNEIKRVSCDRTARRRESWDEYGVLEFPPCGTIFLTDERSSIRKWSSKEARTKRASEEPQSKVLIAEDEPLFRKILSQLLSPEFVTVTEDGTTALAGLQEEDGPVLAISRLGSAGIDWHRRVRGTTNPPANCRHLHLPLPDRSLSPCHDHARFEAALPIRGVRDALCLPAEI